MIDVKFYNVVHQALIQLEADLKDSRRRTSTNNTINNERIADLSKLAQLLFQQAYDKAVKKSKVHTNNDINHFTSLFIKELDSLFKQLARDSNSIPKHAYKSPEQIAAILTRDELNKNKNKKENIMTSGIIASVVMLSLLTIAPIIITMVLLSNPLIFIFMLVAIIPIMLYVLMGIGSVSSIHHSIKHSTDEYDTIIHAQHVDPAPNEREESKNDDSFSKEEISIISEQNSPNNKKQYNGQFFDKSSPKTNEVNQLNPQTDEDDINVIKP